MTYEVAQDQSIALAWRVEAIGDDGECYVAIFTGTCAEDRARHYAHAMNTAQPQWIAQPETISTHGHLRRLK